MMYLEIDGEMLSSVVAAAFDVKAWIVLPLLIFIARIADVSIGTVRVIFVAKGMKYLAPITGFFEVLIWIVVVGQIMQNLSNPACYVAYAAGFATGNYVGMLIAEWLSLGIVLIRVVTERDALPLVDHLKEADYGVTSVDGHGSRGQVKVVFTIVPRREVQRVVDIIKEFNPNAFFTVGEVGSVAMGTFPLRRGWRDAGLLRLFRPFRKGK